MQDLPNLPRRLSASRRLAWAVIGFMVAMLGAMIFLGVAQLRQTTRAQIASRDAAILHAVALAQQLTEESNDALGGQIEHVADQLAVALHISQLKGVIAARLFDGEGRFITAFPASVTEARLPADDLRALRELKPVSRFHPAGPLTDVFAPGTPGLAALKAPQPLLEVTTPFHRQDQTTLLGAVQFVMDGRGIAAEFATLDRNLYGQATLAFVGGSLLVVLALGLAFRRLQAVNRQLVERTASLLRANEELALAAKTSAVGAVTAHLIHGLSSPLTGLHNLVAHRGDGDREPQDTDWQHAVALTQQMQTMIGEVVRVLREHQGLHHYELTLAELAQVVAARAKSPARAAQIRFVLQQSGERTLASREANLVLLILDNLVRNALEATPAGRTVELAIRADDAGMKFDVCDEGPGVPVAVREHLFQPCRSSKPQGSGIGLAICQQLAQHLGAELVLTRTSPQGSVFTLTLPAGTLATSP